MTDFNVIHSQRNFFEQLFVRSDLSKADYKIILYLLCVLDVENYKAISQKNISELIFLDKSIVSKSIKNLINIGIIEKSDDKYISGYRFSLEFRGEKFAQDKNALIQKYFNDI
ncbi:MarR family transcriptional regulator [Desulfosporosinus sp. BICA1-9]|uniref:MarR family transcriptional regulator n=1 Tax=Desulfosporosinus sp. BICA1-9 TaxID=1531958 RepID=UPI00054C1CB7|nr:MarR family transcriptional regulator [Desulfosporosinus sp. BICA1-9]KJS84690.1 MAG: hypothetical protein JL57_20315 [Desulfosporosinus sp. BICA1-9]HBW34206.1 MarR family transcriptional regulator [Desulfosporosinus sp.]